MTSHTHHPLAGGAKRLWILLIVLALLLSAASVTLARVPLQQEEPATPVVVEEPVIEVEAPAIEAAPSPELAAAPMVTIPSSFFTVIDTGGPNDETDQNDLTQMGRDDSDAASYELFWSWDSTDFTAQKGNACALFDNNNNGNIDFAVCVEIQNVPAGDITNVQQTLVSPLAVTCSDGFPLTCKQPSDPLPFIEGTDIEVGDLANFYPSPPANLITDTDPFALGDQYPNDSTIRIRISKAYLNTYVPGANLVNVCTYPSLANTGNNDSKDCVGTAGGGFLEITKVAPDGTTQVFNFTVNPGSIPRSITGAGAAPGISAPVGTGYSVTEAVPVGWKLDSASCTLQSGAATGDPLSGGTVSNITIEVGKLTSCTFTDLPNVLRIYKTLTGGPEGYTPPNFTIHYDCGGTYVGDVSVLPGSYAEIKYLPTGASCTVTEPTLPSPPEGYSFGSPAITGSPATIVAGGTASVTVANSLAPTTGTLIVEKVLDNANGGTLACENFSYTINGVLPAIPFEIDCSNSQVVNAGTYDVLEVGVPIPGYATTYNNCDDVVVPAGGSATCTITNVAQALSVNVTKDAATSLTRTASWTVTKTPDGTYSGLAGDVFPHQYTVAVDRTDTDGSWAATGNIIITNNTLIAATITGVSDLIEGGINATVTCPVSFPYVLAENGGSLTCTYSASLPNADTRLNTATVTTSGWVLGGEGTANINFAAATVNLAGSQQINVTDTNGQSWGPVSVDTSFQPYTRDFTCPTTPSSYVNGVYTASPHVNTATITETGLSAQATVNLTCTLAALVPTKTAAGEWDRTVTWTLTKTVDDDSHSGIAGDTFNSTWTVVADKTDSGPLNFVVAGTISVYNPAAIAQTFTVSDVLNDAAGTVGTVTCPTYTVAPLATVVCTYTAAPLDDSATSNTATVSAPGNPDQTASDPIEWHENLTGYDSGLLTDPRFSYDEAISGDTTETFPETFTCSTDPAAYTNGSYSYTETNWAYLDGNIDLEASEDVTVTCTLAALVPTKTAAGEWDRTVTWTLAKTVDDDSHSGFPGDTFNSTWTVVADKTDSGPLNFVVAGTISVYNPAAIAQTFTVSDVLNDAAGTVGTVTCPTYTVAPLATVVCTYTAAPLDDSATSNTATVSAPGNPDQSASDPIEWHENLTGYDSGDLTDPRFSYDEAISGDTTETFPETFTCSTDPAAYTNGSYSYTETNWAYLDGNIDLEASEDVTVTCTLAALVPTKTAAGEWDRTVTWTLAKTVDDDSHSGIAGATFNSTWTVVADKTDSGPLNFVVAGTISVYNPAAIAQTFTVSDVLNDAAGTVGTVTCPTYTVAPLATVVCTYTAAPLDDSATSNTATVSAPGNPDQTASDPIEWHENLTGYDSGLLTDPRFSYDEAISGDTTETFPETFTCSTDPAAYTNGSYSYTETNWAYLDGNIDLEASEEVTVTCYYPSIALDKQIRAFVGMTADDPPEEIWTEWSDNLDTVLPGQDISYRLIVTNDGPVDLENVTVTDPTLGVTCLVGDLAVGASFTCGPYGPFDAAYNKNDESCNTALATGTAGSITVDDDDTACYTALYWGFTPGFWKNHQEAWMLTEYQTGTSVCLDLDTGLGVFTVPSDYQSRLCKSLLQALSFRNVKGDVGKAMTLMRAAVASLLNASFNETLDNADHPKGVAVFDTVLGREVLMSCDPALPACTDPVVYWPYTLQGVIDAVNEALATKDPLIMIDLAAELNYYNNGTHWWDPAWLPTAAMTSTDRRLTGKVR